MFHKLLKKYNIITMYPKKDTEKKETGRVRQ